MPWTIGDLGAAANALNVKIDADAATKAKWAAIERQKFAAQVQAIATGLRNGAGSAPTGSPSPAAEPAIYKTSPAPYLPDTPYLPPEVRPPATYIVEPAQIQMQAQAQAQAQAQSQAVNQAQNVNVSVAAPVAAAEPQWEMREPETPRASGWWPWIAAAAALFLAAIVLSGRSRPAERERRLTELR